MKDEVERWIYLDGPEPEILRPLLAALREDDPPRSEEDPALEAALLARIDGVAVPAPVAPVGSSAPPTVSPAEVPARFTHQREEASEPVIEVPAMVLPSIAERAEAPPGPVSSARPSLAETALALDVPEEVRRGHKVLPFNPPSAAPAPLPKGRGSAKTKQVPVMRGPGDTVGIDDDAISRAVAAVPFLGETVGAGTVPFPRLELTNYASLRAELTVYPAEVDQRILKYRVVSRVSLRALDAHWEERFSQNPVERAQYEALLPGFVAHVRAMPR